MRERRDDFLSAISDWNRKLDEKEHRLRSRTIWLRISIEWMLSNSQHKCNKVNIEMVVRAAQLLQFIVKHSNTHAASCCCIPAIARAQCTRSTLAACVSVNGCWFSIFCTLSPSPFFLAPSHPPFVEKTRKCAFHFDKNDVQRSIYSK